MSEQKQGNSPPEIKKKHHFASRIIWLTWVSVLLLLLVAGLVLEAPWKITTLVFIFLLADTILPRVYRKWFWAGVGCVAAVVIIWIFLPEDSEDWRPYTFDEELAALEAKRAIPDNENASIIYNQLLEDCNKAFYEVDFIDSDLRDCTGGEPWSSKDCPGMARWLGQRKGAIAKLIEASKIEQCRFPINADAMRVDDIMHRLRPIQSWALLLNWAANNDIAEGRTEEGLQKYISLLQMGKHQNQQPSQLDFMVGTGIELRSINQLKRFVVTGDAAEEHLILIEKALAEIKRDWSYDLPKILDYEKLAAKNLWGLFYEVNPEGKIRLTLDLANAIRKQLPQDMKGKLVITYWYKRLMKASTILCWFCMPSTPQKVGAIVDSAYERCYTMAKSDFNWQKGPREFSAASIKFNCRYIIEAQLCILEPTYYNIHDTYLRTIAQQRGSRLIIALRRYKNKNGSWPVSLNEVKSSASEEIFVDPINGGSFVYKLTDENFTLYSKGKNGIDDGGKRDNWYEQTGADDLMIWSSEDS
jgi:tetratricopeptide (TPR) repeat protein